MYADFILSAGKRLVVLILITAVSCPGGASPVLTSSSNGVEYRVDLVAKDLQIPWGAAFIAPHKLLITQRHGGAVIIDSRQQSLTPVVGLPEVSARGQGGLLDVAVEPGYQQDGGWLYFTYSKSVNRRAVTVLARSKLNGNRLSQWQELLVTNSATETHRHFGSRIAFDRQGHLFFSVGDRGRRANGQDLTTHAGSILRLNMDGSVPPDNPFSNHPTALPEIWSYGHRNPQGLAYDTLTQRLWAIEHGPRGGDEINLVKKGRNYGWPITSHGQEYWGPVDVGESREKPGIEAPKKVYIPSIAPGSLLLYTGQAFPNWQGSLFSGALKLRHINQVWPDPDSNIGGEARLVSGLGERIRALIQSDEGWIYFTTDNGNLYRISPAP